MRERGSRGARRTSLSSAPRCWSTRCTPPVHMQSRRRPLRSRRARRPRPMGSTGPLPSMRPREAMTRLPGRGRWLPSTPRGRAADRRSLIEHLLSTLLITPPPPQQETDVLRQPGSGNPVFFPISSPSPQTPLHRTAAPPQPVAPPQRPPLAPSEVGELAEKHLSGLSRCHPTPLVFGARWTAVPSQGRRISRGWQRANVRGTLSGRFSVASSGDAKVRGYEPRALFHCRPPRRRTQKVDNCMTNLSTLAIFKTPKPSLSIQNEIRFW